MMMKRFFLSNKRLKFFFLLFANDLILKRETNQQISTKRDRLRKNIIYSLQLFVSRLLRDNPCPRYARVTRNASPFRAASRSHTCALPLPALSRGKERENQRRAKRKRKMNATENRGGEAHNNNDNTKNAGGNFQRAIVPIQDVSEILSKYDFKEKIGTGGKLPFTTTLQFLLGFWLLILVSVVDFYS
jgi:hypothetical protein